MKTSIFSGLVLSLSLFARCSFAGGFDVDATPRVEIVKYKVILSTIMAAAVKIYDPEFKIWEAQDFDSVVREMYTYGFYHGKYIINYQAPSAVIGDFNGDKIPDIALLGHNKTHEKRIVILSKNTGYEIIELLNYPFPAGISSAGRQIEGILEFVPAGRKIKAEPAFNRPEINLKTDAFIHGDERGSSLYYYKNGKFVSYALSD